MQLKTIKGRKPKLVLSIYPNKRPLEELKDYLLMAKKHGFTTFFTNLIGIQTEQVKDFTALCQFAKKNEIDIIADIDESVCQRLDFTLDDITPLRSLGIKGIRMDVKFDAKKITKLALDNPDFVFEINASDFSGIEKEITAINPHLTNIQASHNFFPQKFTGLSVDKFERSSASMKAANMKVGAFLTNELPGSIRAWNDNDGTPTLEIQRTMAMTDQMQLLAASRFIDYLIVSDMFASEQQLAFYAEMNMSRLHLKIRMASETAPNEEAIVKHQWHALRGDNPEQYMFRSTMTRKLYTQPIAPRTPKSEFLEAGDVVVLNDLAGRYKGELHVLKTRMPWEKNKNLVGKIPEDQHPLLSLDRVQQEFFFSPVTK